MDITIYKFRQWMFCFIAAALIAGLGSSVAMAAAADPGDIHQADGVFRAFLTDVSNVIAAVLTPGSPAGDFVHSLFITLVIGRLAWVIAMWSFREMDDADVITSIIIILLVSGYMEFYDSITAGLHDWASSFAGSVQKEMLGTSNVFFAPWYLNDMMNSLKPQDVTWWAPLRSVLAFLALDILSFIMSMLAFFIVTWATWGYALAKLIGWMMIPFLLLPVTAQWYNKWFGFFAGFLFFEIIGRINVAMTLMVMTRYFNMPISTLPSQVIELNGESLSDFTGLFSIMIVAIFSLMSTGKFAASFGAAVAGSGGGGVAKGIKMLVMKGL